MANRVNHIKLNHIEILCSEETRSYSSEKLNSFEILLFAQHFRKAYEQHQHNQFT